jgi:hypothetical protein
MRGLVQSMHEMSGAVMLCERNSEGNLHLSGWGFVEHGTIAYTKPFVWIEITCGVRLLKNQSNRKRQDWRICAFSSSHAPYLGSTHSRHVCPDAKNPGDCPAGCLCYKQVVLQTCMPALSMQRRNQISPELVHHAQQEAVLLFRVRLALVGAVRQLQLLQRQMCTPQRHNMTSYHPLAGLPMAAASLDLFQVLEAPGTCAQCRRAPLLHGDAAVS